MTALEERLHKIICDVTTNVHLGVFFFWRVPVVVSVSLWLEKIVASILIVITSFHDLSGNFPRN